MLSPFVFVRMESVSRNSNVSFKKLYHCTIYSSPTGYTIQWNQRNIPVFRSDVECTNGIIHVIDHPFLVDSDIRVTGGASTLHRFQNIAYVFIVNILIFIVGRTLMI